MKKLSKAMQEVIDFMESGWELGCSISCATSYRAWLQKGGCGRGGEVKDVHGNTIHALIDRGLIEVKERKFPIQTYKLSK